MKKGNFITWPGIEDVKFKKMFGTPLTTALRHLDQERTNLQSTKHQEDQKDEFPDKIPQKITSSFYEIVDIPEKPQPTQAKQVDSLVNLQEGIIISLYVTIMTAMQSWYILLKTGKLIQLLKLGKSIMLDLQEMDTSQRNMSLTISVLPS